MLYNLLSLKPSPSNSPSPEPTPSFRQETLTFLLSLGLSSDPSENPLKFSKKLDKKIFKNPIVLGTVKKKTIYSSVMLGSSKDGPHWQLWSLFQTFARFIAELFCHQLVLPWLKHGFKKDQSLPWTSRQ